MNGQTGVENRFSRVVAGIGVLVWLAGIVWLWLNSGQGDTLMGHVVVVVLLGTVWTTLVAIGTAILAAMLGLAVIAASPFRRR